MNKTFSYFAYGSNLLSQRIHVNSPSAVRKGIGKIKNFRLDFNRFSTRWKGASATIVPCENHFVWGAIWEISVDDLPRLDKQEGVDQQIYTAWEAPIETPEGTITKCRVYQQMNLTDPTGKSQLPSQVYLDTIIRGAAESRLPKEYQEFLRSLPHNGYNGPVNLEILLD